MSEIMFELVALILARRALLRSECIECFIMLRYGSNIFPLCTSRNTSVYTGHRLSSSISSKTNSKLCFTRLSNPYVIIGSRFGGSVSAMRLAEKGYSFLVLEAGKAYKDQDFATTNWKIGKYLWVPALRCFGILKISILKGAMVLHGRGVGGGSLGYANVLEIPPHEVFTHPIWKKFAGLNTQWEQHYQTSLHMLGVTINPQLQKTDTILQEVISERSWGNSFLPAQVGVYFGEGETLFDIPTTAHILGMAGERERGGGGWLIPILRFTITLASMWWMALLSLAIWGLIPV